MCLQIFFLPLSVDILLEVCFLWKSDFNIWAYMEMICVKFFFVVVNGSYFHISLYAFWFFFFFFKNWTFWILQFCNTRFSSPPHALLLSFQGLQSFLYLLFSKLFFQGLYSLSCVVTEILLSGCLAVIFQISLVNGSWENVISCFFADCLLAEVLLQRLGRLPTALP